MIRTACIAAALIGGVAAATPAAAEVIVRYGGPVYRGPVYVAPRPVYRAPVYVAPRAVYVAPRAVYVAPRPVCRSFNEKIVTVRPNGTRVVRWQPVTRC